MSFTSAPAVPASRWRDVLLMVAALASICAVIAAGGLMPHVGWLMPLFVLGGTANAAMNSIVAVLLSRRAPSAARGRAFGYFGAVASGASMTGLALGGVLVGRLAPGTLLVASGTLLVASGTLGLIVVAACALPMLRAARRERARVASAVDAAVQSPPAGPVGRLAGSGYGWGS